MIFVTLMFAIMVPGNINAQILEKFHKDLSVSVNLDTNSKYVWRGITWVDDMVFQPDVSVSFKGATFGIWNNVLCAKNPTEGGVGVSPASTEVDYYLDYSGECKILQYSLGWIYYQFPHTDIESTQELYATFGLGVPLNPSLTVYADIEDNAGGLYWNLAMSHDIEMAGITFTPSFGTGIGNTIFASYYTMVDDFSGLFDMNFGLNVAVPLGGIFEKLGGVMNLHVNYSFFPGRIDA